MNIHCIHDSSNSKIIKMLSNEFSKITDNTYIKNYHPDFSSCPGNFFFILDSGRYKPNFGKYFVIEEDNKYISSAGWNIYEYSPSVALLLTRAYVSPNQRSNYTLGNYILPLIIEESSTKCNQLWITVNRYNYKFKKWLEFSKNRKTVPDLYKKFRLVGDMDIYFTKQTVFEYSKDSDDR
jgi:hypothetical protein